MRSLQIFSKDIPTMVSFISTLLTLGIAYWFYRTAERLGLQALHWGLAGVIAYLVPAGAWMLLVSKPYMATIRNTSARSSMSAFIFDHSWILIGALCAFAVYKFFLLRTPAKAG